MTKQIDCGQIYIRRAVYVEAPRTRVWQEFTSFARIHAWLGIGHTLHALEPAVGGVADFSIDLDGTEAHFGGPVTKVETESELTFEVRWANADLDAGGPMRWSYLLSDFRDGTVVEFYQYGFDDLPEVDGEDILGYESAWQPNHLARLREIILS